MISIITAVMEREAAAFANKMAQKYGFSGPDAFLDDLLNTAMQQVMDGEKWSSEETDFYCPVSGTGDDEVKH